MLQASSGDVAGVGVSLSTDNERDLPLIVGIESGTPAAEAGLKVMSLGCTHRYAGACLKRMRLGGGTCSFLVLGPIRGHYCLIPGKNIHVCVGLESRPNSAPREPY